MTASGGFEYYLDGVKLKNYDDFEKRIKRIEVKINVDSLKIYATTV